MAKPNKKDSRVFVLVGGGAASLAAAETLRQEGFTGRIIMLSKEPRLPYDRVRLSKNPDIDPDSLTLRQSTFFEQYGIEVMLETLVTRVDAKGQEVHYSQQGSDEVKLKYDACLVASGGTPRKLFCPGAELKGVFT